MAFGTWTILDPTKTTYETLDLTSLRHQRIMEEPFFYLRDAAALNAGGLSGTTDQVSAPLPVFGDWDVGLLIHNIATYSAGTLLLFPFSPSTDAQGVALAAGAGADYATAVISSVAGAARGGLFRGPLLPNTRVVSRNLAGAGTADVTVCLLKRRRV